MPNDTIANGDVNNLPNDTGLTQAGDAFLARLMSEEDASKKKPSEEGKENTTPISENKPEDNSTPADDDQTPEDDQSDKGEEPKEKPAEENADQKKYVEDEDTLVKIKVGDEEHEVPVKDIKRLYGQEAALTRRSQEVATQRQAVEQSQQQYTAGIGMLTQWAEQRANQFRGIDFMALARNPDISPEQLTALQQEAQDALQQEAFFKGELGKVNEFIHQQTMNDLANRAKETVKVLGDQASPHYIEGWNKETYENLIGFAREQGVPAEQANSLVDAPAFKILHMAYMYQKGQTAKGKSKVINKTPTKIIKSNSSPVSEKASSAKSKEAMAKLKKSGKQEDAVDAFLANWADKDAE